MDLVVGVRQREDQPLIIERLQLAPYDLSSMHVVGHGSTP
jgi:hypothetical protein